MRERECVMFSGVECGVECLRRPQPQAATPHYGRPRRSTSGRGPALPGSRAHGLLEPRVIPVIPAMDCGAAVGGKGPEGERSSGHARQLADTGRSASRLPRGGGVVLSRRRPRTALPPPRECRRPASTEPRPAPSAAAVAPEAEGVIAAAGAAGAATVAWANRYVQALVLRAGRRTLLVLVA